MKTIALLSTKGGTGKTTLSAHFAGVLNELGKSVLLIDADLRQPSLSSYFPLAEAGEGDYPGLQSFLNDNDWQSAIQNTIYPNLDIIVSATDNTELENFINRQATGRLLLLNRLKELGQKKIYDYVVIDSWGSTGAVTEMAALAATNIILCPTMPEKLSALELLRNTLPLCAGIQSLASFGKVKSPKPKIVFNAVSSRTRDAQEIMEFLRERLNGEADIVNTVVPRKVAFNEAASGQCPISVIETNAEIVKDNSATRAIFSLLVELLPELKRQVKSDKFKVLLK